LGENGGQKQRDGDDNVVPCGSSVHGVFQEKASSRFISRRVRGGR
jgi:hypothetical protein